MFFLEALCSLYDSVWLLISHVADRSSFPPPLNADEEAQAV